MMDEFEGRHRSPALDEFRDRLGDEFLRVSRSPSRKILSSPRRVAVAALAFAVLGAGAAVAATSEYPKTITVTEMNGDTHPGVLGGVAVRGPDGVATMRTDISPPPAVPQSATEQGKHAKGSRSK
jgi:hypothetical protein